MSDLRDLSFDELRAALSAMGEPGYRAEQIFAWIFRRGAPSLEDCTDLPKALRAKLAAKFSLAPLEKAGISRSRDRTEKILFRLADGLAVETVMIPSGPRRTICLSTQAGCKFACAFCASGLRGFKRNLTPAEILVQVLFSRTGPADAVSNLVFMGMGEPLDNFDNLEKSVRILNDPRGFGLAARRMTVSTCGLVPGIDRLAGLDLQINLSISLHAADDETRNRLMPVNRRFPLSELTAACERYLRDGGRRITLEYVLLRGVNDRASDAERLARFALRLEAKVNLIPYSPVEGLAFIRPEDDRVAAFARRLEGRRVGTTIRDSKGGDIRAACGQLALRSS